MRAVLFVGPSLAGEDVRLPPGFFVLPPALQGDVISAVQDIRPNVIAIVDGYFYQSLSVWHKEILYALGEGVTVIGGASIGALRAAELSAYGMKGIGWVFEQFESGALTDDDEVALLHGPADQGYPKLTEPMVNVRATLGRVKSAGRLDQPLIDLTIETTKQLTFTDRTFANISKGLLARGVSPSSATEVVGTLRENYIDIKKDDALAIVRFLAEGPPPESPSISPTVNKTRFFDALFNCDRNVQLGTGRVSLGSIARYASLHLKQIHYYRSNSINRELTVLLARILNISPNQKEIAQEEAAFRLNRNLQSGGSLAEWLALNNLSESEFRELIVNLAVGRKMQNWWLSNEARMERGTKAVLNELRLTEQYTSVVEALLARDALENDMDPPEPEPQDLAHITKKYPEVDWHMPIEDWLLRNGFLSFEQLKEEVAKDNHRSVAVSS